MKAPEFWWKEKPTLCAWLLWPLGLVYGAVTARRMGARGIISRDQKIICIGNFTAGGAGKTPIAIAVAKLLLEKHCTVCFLSRGYGGTTSVPVLVDPQIHTAELVGDEPLLLARIAPTIVSKNRADGLKLCIETGADIIIMDDGLQNPSVKKDFSVAVVDSETGIGNGLCIPAGPLRAPIDKQLDHVQMVVFMGDGQQSILEQKLRQLSIPFFKAGLEAPSHILSSLRDKAFLAYCGIGRPDKFFNYIEKLGGYIAKRYTFSDHHAFTAREAKRLLEEAQSEHLVLITTEKDFVRLPKDGSFLGVLVARSRVLPVEAVFNDPQTFISHLL